MQAQPMGEPSTVAVSVVVPVYRSAPTIANLVRSVREVLQSMGMSYEILLVDDSSPDEETRTTLDGLERAVDVRVVRMRRNRGQHVATIVGLSLCRGDISVTMDADLQHDPSNIHQLLAPLFESPELDAVVARFPRSRHPLLRRIGSRIVGALIRWSYALPPGFAFTSFLAMRADARNAVVASGLRSLDPIVGLTLVDVTDRVINVDVDHARRGSGRSGWRPLRLVRLTLQLIQAVLFTRPGLRLLAGTAVTAALVAMGLAAFYLIRFWAAGMPLSGFTTTVLLLLTSIALSAFLLSALLEGVAGLRDSAWRTTQTDIRTDSWSGRDGFETSPPDHGPD